MSLMSLGLSSCACADFGGAFDEAIALYERVLHGHETRMKEQKSNKHHHNHDDHNHNHNHHKDKDNDRDDNDNNDDNIVCDDDDDDNDDLITLEVVNNLGNVLYRQGQLEEAKEMFERAQRGYEAMVGVEGHTDMIDDLILRTMSNLANVLHAQGK